MGQLQKFSLYLGIVGVFEHWQEAAVGEEIVKKRSPSRSFPLQKGAISLMFLSRALLPGKELPYLFSQRKAVFGQC
ncbi:hypothetical protein [Desulfoferrobacter suflitae]|uniref:hypothetical protein n=1 Tax=Desulfoferrobacter suflitae TaxID=2865782 RepID=UPI0021647604|nr:hypothetical protein [Desulfoferrobacter suflitae]MCK8601097.1 hypothetical protein [Desulfoferrobacter suflitae]